MPRQPVGPFLSYRWAMLGGMGGTERLGRAAVLAYRLRAHDLSRPAPGPPGVLDVGIQDTPPGSVAPLALAARSRRPPAAYADPALALVHGVRGTMHLHRVADLALLAAALRPDDAADLLVSTHGPFFRERAAEGLPIDEIFDVVAAAMRLVMADGVMADRITADRTMAGGVPAGGAERTKGELSTAITPLVPKPVAPWCGGCGARHVHDGLFRMASLQAGLRLRPAGDGSAVFLPPTGERGRGAGAVERERPDATAARRELTRRFLRRCGPTTVDALAAWLGFAPPAARRWWAALRDELVEVDVEGRRLWCHRDDLPGPADARSADGVWLLPPFDPLVELADRPLLVPDPARRRKVWRATANPGVLLMDGELAGTWRQRRSRGRPTVTVTPFGRPPDEPAVARAAEALLGSVDLIIGPPDP
jgi:hypothetical protein